ncbi:hypothetical protein D3C86_1995510 [compost metagenome]
MPSLFKIFRSSIAVSPLCELCASSTITAKRLPAVEMATPFPLASMVRMAWVMKGNFWMVEMMIGTPSASALANCCVFSSIFCTTPSLCSNWKIVSCSC